MELLVVAQSRIQFKLDGKFEWVGWTGHADLKTAARDFKIAGAIVATIDDLKDWIPSTLKDKQYKGQNFDVPGSVLSVPEPEITIEEPSNGLQIEGVAAVTKQTRGTFKIQVKPAMDSKPKPPVPDTMIRKTGTWWVEDPGQTIAEVI